MSQSYLVRCKASVCEVKSSKDSVVTTLSLTKLVSPEEQGVILVDVLKAHGFKEVDSRTLTKEKDGIIQIVDLTDMTITTTIEKQETIKKEKAIGVRTGSRSSQAQEKLRRDEEAKLKKSIEITDAEREKIETKLQKEIAAKLQATEEERKQEVNQIVKDVYVESLKKKASSLGEITSIRETTNGSDYEVRIKITDQT